jgi:hypothetical protein
MLHFAGRDAAVSKEAPGGLSRGIDRSGTRGLHQQAMVGVVEDAQQELPDRMLKRRGQGAMSSIVPFARRQLTMFPNGVTEYLHASKATRLRADATP